MDQQAKDGNELNLATLNSHGKCLKVIDRFRITALQLGQIIVGSVIIDSSREKLFFQLPTFFSC
jgi:hypothetical protein